MTKPILMKLEDPALRKEKGEMLNRPVRPVDLEQIDSVGDLMGAFRETSIQARSVGTVAEIFGRMMTDPERPTIILGLADPLIPAGQRKVVRDMIEFGMVDAVVSTGAILYQDYYQAQGFHHFQGTPAADDAKLRDLLIDRIYDTYVDEEQFSRLDALIGRFADTLPPGEYSSRTFLDEMAKSVSDPQSILRTAYRRGVPMFSPALNDSSIGIGLTEHYHRAQKEKRRGVVIHSIRDNYELTQIVVKSKRTAAFYVAGGVPKNFINDAIVTAYMFGRNTGGHKYAVQLTTDAPHWGGLSGSTLREGTSWGKVHKEATHQMAFVEPSVSLPLVVGRAFQKKWHQKRTRISYEWKGNQLERISYGVHANKTREKVSV